MTLEQVLDLNFSQIAEKKARDRAVRDAADQRRKEAIRRDSPVPVPPSSGTYYSGGTADPIVPNWVGGNAFSSDAWAARLARQRAMRPSYLQPPPSKESNSTQLFLEWSGHGGGRYGGT
jgi:hypothetical protein